MTEREIFFEALEMPTPEARAAYLASPGNHQGQQSDIWDWEVRKEIPPHPTDQMIVTGDTVWRQFVALVRTSKRPWRR